MEEDDWEEPERFWQVLSVGGFVTNVEDGEKALVDAAMQREDHSVIVDDIYGDEAVLYCKHIIGMKLWTRRGGERWRRRNNADGWRND